jgi:hypothetical protein
VSAAIDHDPVGLVLDRLHGAGCNPKQASSGQWNAKCPVSANHAHGDKNPSLSVGTGPDGKALVCCHKGCRLPDIAHALDIGVHDMFPPRPRATIGDGKRIVISPIIPPGWFKIGVKVIDRQRALLTKEA